MVRVDVDEGFHDGEEHTECDYSGLRIARLVLQSDLDRTAAAQRAKASRTAEEIEAEDAAWDRMIEEMIADLPPEKPEVEIPNLPDLPIDREPTEAELWALSNAIRKHMDYLKKGEQIEAKRQRDAETKIRTRVKREAEQADPEGAAAARRVSKQSQTAERQRRWRQRQKAPKDTSP